MLLRLELDLNIEVLITIDCMCISVKIITLTLGHVELRNLLTLQDKCLYLQSSSASDTTKEQLSRKQEVVKVYQEL